jgi:uncharacterized protein (UPF0264 family)
MRLLVSVANVADAVAALAGGADIIDAKDPARGSLGAVAIETLHRIRAAIGAAQLLSAALGDAAGDGAVRALAAEYGKTGASLVKVGFAGMSDLSQVQRALEATVEGAAHAGVGVVAVAYADANRAGALPADRIPRIAARAGARGVLLDTADKVGPSLREMISADGVADWVRQAHDQHLFVALAGRLTCDDLAWAIDAGADIIGVRGAACEGGRLGRVTVPKVRDLKAQVAAMTPRSVASSLAI